MAQEPDTRRNTILNAAQRETLVTGYRDGIAVGDLARRHAVHPQTVKEHLRRAGIQVAEPGRTLEPAIYRRIVDLAATGVGSSEIAAATKVSISTIRRIIAAEQSRQPRSTELV